MLLKSIKQLCLFIFDSNFPFDSVKIAKFLQNSGFFSTRDHVEHGKSERSNVILEVLRGFN